MAFIGRIFEDPSVPDWVKAEALVRVDRDPGIPVSDPTDSYWMRDIPDEFSSAPSSALPAHSKYLIIGSGVTGTSVARELAANLASSDSPTARITMLDARNICAGATGRNGGHINEVGFADYREIKDAIGKDAAMKILRFRLNHLQALTEVAEEEGIKEATQIRAVDSVTGFFSQEPWEDVKHAVTVFKEDFGAEAADWKIVEDPEEIKKLGLPSAVGIIVGRAGAVWPYKLITGILHNLGQNTPTFQAFPFTAVTKVDRQQDGAFSVETSRGKITAEHVFHCSNSHVSHLVPAFRGRVFPVRGQMSAQTAPAGVPFQGDVRSWSFNYHVGFDYLTQLPEKYELHGETQEGGEMMLGGGMVQAEFHGIEEIGVAEDNALNPEIKAHLSESLSTAFSATSPATVKAMWTGTLGFSTDACPWVGHLPDSVTKRTFSTRSGSEEESSDTTYKGAEWASVGYTGEGMVNAWLCGKALALMALGKADETTSWFPEQYGITEQRIQESDIHKVVCPPA